MRRGKIQVLIFGFIMSLVFGCDKYSPEEGLVIDFIVSQLNDPDSFRLDNIVVENVSKKTYFTISSLWIHG